MKRSLFLFLIMGFIGIAAFIPKADDPVERLLASLQRWIDTNPQEKIYLHTDKPYYIVGDTIWFKAYVTIGSKHQLSALSGAVYIDLINEGDSIAKTLKLPLTAGMAKGNLILSDTLMREGNYRLRAYTQWMRNAGPEYFYDRTFSVGNAVTNPVFAKINYIYTKEGTVTKVKALLKYTTLKGEPYSNKLVSYAIKESYKTITKGNGKTNELGEITINLSNVKPGEIHSSYLSTKITISGNENIPKIFPIKTAALQTDVQFFPEGGNLVNGVRSRVAFKATGTGGLGVPVKGAVMDNTDKEVAKIESKHLGMGYFNLTPENGKSYHALISYPDGSVSNIKLPAAARDGYVLSVYNNPETDSVLVRLSAGSGPVNNGNEVVSVIAQSGGTVYYAMTVQVKRPITSVLIPVKSIASGILQFTLFSASGDPLNERIIFIQNNDEMDLKINTFKNEYTAREKVELELEAKDATGKPIVGNFSVAVTSEDVVPSDETDENTIFSQLLLSSDIKGYIEKPNYYFYNPTAKTRADLDLLMLTQGYRRFAWKELISGQPFTPAYKAEKLLTNISGRLLKLNNKPLSDGKVTLINNKSGLILDTVSDKNGAFKFDNMLLTDSVEFTIQGRTSKNRKKLEVRIDNISVQGPTPNLNIGDINTDIPKVLKASIENNIEQDMDLQRHGKMGRAQQLKEVKIEAIKKARLGNLITESQADEVYKPDNRKTCRTLMECLEEMDGSRIRFNTINDPECGILWIPMYKRVQYAVIIDNMAIAPCDYQSFFSSFDPAEIEKIYFSHESRAITTRMLSRVSGSLRSNEQAVMMIFTKRGNFRNRYEPSVVYYAPKGYDPVKEFYSPKYDNTNINNPIADLRSTIYWNPSTITNSNGKAKLTYFNSDHKGTYRVVVEGINADGLLGRQVYRYKVK